MQTAALTRAPKRRLLKDRNGCAVCRRRKVKCDGRENGCLNCERLGFKCSFSGLVHPTLPRDDDDGVIPRKRVRQACELCKKNKIRCSGGLPQCERCESKGNNCIYQHAPAHQPKSAQGPIESEDRAESCEMQGAFNDASDMSQVPLTEHSYTPRIRDLDVSKLVIQQHIDAFFQYVYVAGPFNFIHRGSFLRTWHNGKMAKSLLCAVFGVASRFMNLESASSHTDDAMSPSNLMSEVERQVLCEIRPTTIPKVQILLLLLYDRMMSGDLSAVWDLAALASRNAYGLQLNHPIDCIPFTNQECRRRLMWCIYIMDKSSTGTIYPALCPRDSMHIQLPCDSRSFDLEFECKNPSLEEAAHSPNLYSHSSTLGVTSYLIRVLDLRDQIKRFIDYKKRDSSINPITWESDPSFCSFREGLAAFGNGLPPDMQDSELAIHIRSNTAESDVYIMVQGWLRASWCELLREAATFGGSSLTGFTETCAGQLIQQAIGLSQFLKTIVTVQSPSRKFLVTDWGIAPCLMEMTKALLHCAAQPSIKYGQDLIKSALALNFDILDPLATISQFVASWRDEIIYLISQSPYASIVQHRMPGAGKTKRFLETENVLAEARQAENARFPKHAAFRKENQVANNSSYSTSQSNLYGNGSLEGQTIDAALGTPDDWIVSTGVEIPNFDMDGFYAERGEGIMWDFPFVPSMCN